MTTLEQRQRHKEKRRFKKIENLARKINLKCQKSQRTLKIIDEVLLRVAQENASIIQYLEAIRRAN